MVEVISIETIKVPQNVAGYASVKTGLSRQGLLALNTGILDPGYEGPLSATVVNFGKSDSLLNHGDTFLRLTFHEYDRLQTSKLWSRGTGTVFAKTQGGSSAKLFRAVPKP